MRLYENDWWLCDGNYGNQSRAERVYEEEEKYTGQTDIFVVV